MRDRVSKIILDVTGISWIALGRIRAHVLDETKFPWADWRYRVADALLYAQWIGNDIGVSVARCISTDAATDAASDLASEAEGRAT